MSTGWFWKGVQHWNTKNIILSGYQSICIYYNVIRDIFSIVNLKQKEDDLLPSNVMADKDVMKSWCGILRSYNNFLDFKFQTNKGNGFCVSSPHTSTLKKEKLTFLQFLHLKMLTAHPLKPAENLRSGLLQLWMWWCSHLKYTNDFSVLYSIQCCQIF